MPTHTPSPTSITTSTATPTRNPIRPFLVGIDPGHGGRDLGARHFQDGHMDFYESEIVLDISLRLARMLDERGHAAVLTRDGDYYLNDEERKDYNEDGNVDRMDQLQQRVDIINIAGADLLLSLHLNSYEGEDAEKVGGVTTYYCAAREFSDKSLRFAQLIQEHTLATLTELGYQPKDRGVRTDLEAGTPDEHLILIGPADEDCARPSQMPGALSESLFISHEEEAKLLQQEGTREALARALLDAIEVYMVEVAGIELGD